MVPFKAIYEYLKTIEPDLDEDWFLGVTGISGGSFGYYHSGNRDGKPYAPKQTSILNKLFAGICSDALYDVTPPDYKDKAKRLISHLVSHRQINEGFLDINDYLERINREDVPEKDNEFQLFLRNSVFHEFFVTYVKLWSNDAYRAAKPISVIASKGINPVLVFEDNFKDHMPQQLLSPESEETLFTLDLKAKTCNWDFFVKHPLTLITGPGGQGKTTFLYALYKKHENTPEAFKHIFIVPLINLTELNITDVNVDENLIERYITSRFLKWDFRQANERCLVLIDGYNEFRASPNPSLVSRIGNSLTQFIQKIINRDYPGVSLVLTSREASTTLSSLPFKNDEFMSVCLSGTSQSAYNDIKNKYEEYSFSFEGTEIEELAKIPLYAKMLKELKTKKELSKTQDKYALFDAVYHRRANQRLGSESHKNAYEKGYYLYFYYVILPSFAYELNTSDNYNGFYFRDIEIEQLMRSALRNNLDVELYRYFRNEERFGEIDATVPRIDAVKLEEFLKNEESVIIKKEYRGSGITYRFEHQEWRDYLVAKFLRTNVQLLQSNFSSSQYDALKAYRVNCNVDSNVARMVLQSFDMASSPEANAEKAKAFFKFGKIISKNLFGIVRLLHIAFDFNEYLQLELPVGENKTNPELSNIFRELTNYFLNHMSTPVLLENADDDQVKSFERKSASRKRFIEFITSDNEITYYLCEILSKETEYYRRRYNYSKVLEILNIANVICEDSDIIRQQSAKLYLCVFEDRFTPRLRYVTPEKCRSELDNMSSEELFVKGMEQLKIVAGKGFHLSANTIGIFLSNPAPVLIKHVKSLTPDFGSAFGYYMNVIYAAHYTKRDIAYTVRQALSLLLKGYIRITEENTFDPEDELSDLSGLAVEKCDPLFSQGLNGQNADFALQLVKSAEGQQIAGMNYLRGCAAYAHGDMEEARFYWSSPLKNETTLLYEIARKYRLHEDGLDKAIDEGFEANVKKILPAGDGKIDLTHPAYWYIEAKETELALLNGQEKEVRKAFFETLEKRYGASETLSVIYGFLRKSPT